jgi:cyanophycinase
MAEHPQLLGIGIDEQMAIIVEPSLKFEVIGEQSVIVYDTSQAKIKILPSQSIGFSRMIMHLLLPGDKFDLKKRKVITQ